MIKENPNIYVIKGANLLHIHQKYKNFEIQVIVTNFMLLK